MTNLSRWIGYGLGLVLAAGFGVALAGPAAASPSPTTTTLTSSATTPLVSGQPVTFTATVAEVPPGSGVPSGTVTFAFAPTVTCAGGVTIEPLVAGTAQCTTTGLLAAQSPEEVTASYLGDTTDAASSSSQYTQPVGAAATTVTVSSSAVHPAFNGMGCSTTASVTAVTCSSLSGLGVGASVSDVDGAIPPGTTVASVVHTAFTLSNAATVTESGDTLTFVNDPTRSLPSGHPALFTATVALAAPATGTPSGTVTWTITGADASVVACANGTTANVNRRTLVEQCRVPQGVLMSASSPYAVSATYSGDASYAGSGGTFSQIINPATTRAFVAGTRIPVFPATAESFTAAVVPSTFGGPPTGSATFAFAALPFKVNGCNLSSGTSTVNCAQGALSGVVAGYDVTDVTTPGAIPPGATVLTIATRAGSATLSAAPSTLTGQQLLFTPDGSGIPRADCNGGDTLSYAPTGTTCTVATGFPSANAVWGLVVTYSGDLNDGVSSSRQMKLTVQ
jgi:hypothetical protein